jgi:hypothetical protein
MGKNFVLGDHRLIFVTIFFIVLGCSSLCTLFASHFVLTILVWNLETSTVTEAFFSLKNGLVKMCFVGNCFRSLIGITLFAFRDKGYGFSRFTGRNSRALQT